MGTTRYPGCPTFATRRDVRPLIGSWPAWARLLTASYGVGLSMINDPAAPDDNKTDYGNRQYVGSAGIDPSWYLNNTGNAAAEQARKNDELAQLNTVCGIYFPLWYPASSQITFGPNPPSPDVTHINTAGRTLYLNSPNKALAKFAYIIASNQASYDGNTPHTWQNFVPNFIPQWVQDFQDPMYAKIGNRPIVGLFSNTGGLVPWDAGHAATLTAAVIAAGMGAPYYIQMNADVTNANAIPTDALTAYGPSGAGLSAPNTRHPFTDLIAKANTIDVLPGLNCARCFTLVHCADSRPRVGPGGGPFSDRATYSQNEQWYTDRYQKARSCFRLNPDHLTFEYNMDELDEGGDYFPTAQSRVRGVNTPSLGNYLDARHNVLNYRYPTTFDDHVHFATAGSWMVRSTPANWTLVQSLTGASGGNTGAWEYSENSNTTAADTWTYTSPYPVTRLVLLGRLFPGGGTFNCHHDAVANVLVNQANGVTLYQQVLYDSGVLAPGIHSLTGTIVTGCSGAEIAVSRAR